MCQVLSKCAGDWIQRKYVSNLSSSFVFADANFDHNKAKAKINTYYSSDLPNHVSLSKAFVWD